MICTKEFMKENSSKRVRLEWIDLSKGLLIILVVLGHCHLNVFTDTIINSFHMFAFFTLSGITLRTEKNIVMFIRGKIKAIILPYFFFSLVLLVYQYASSIIIGGQFNLLGGVESIFIPISGRAPTSVYHLWFLPCIFFTYIIAYFIARFWKKVSAQ